MQIFKNHVYFSVTPFVLNDVNVRGGKVIKPSQEKLVLLDFSLTVKAAPHECEIRTCRL